MLVFVLQAPCLYTGWQAGDGFVSQISVSHEKILELVKMTMLILVSKNSNIC